MALSSRHVDALIDILENKLSDMLVWDSEDRREIVILKGCLDELQEIKATTGDIVAFDQSGKRSRRGRARASAA